MNAKESINCATGWKRNSTVWFLKRAVTGVPQTRPLLDGEPYIALIDYAKEQEMDMIVLGIRGHTLLEKLLVGSTTDRLIRHAPSPVLAVR